MYIHYSNDILPNCERFPSKNIHHKTLLYRIIRNKLTDANLLVLLRYTTLSEIHNSYLKSLSQEIKKSHNLSDQKNPTLTLHQYIHPYMETRVPLLLRYATIFVK